MTSKLSRLGLVVRTDRTGLGYQSRALEKMLGPDKTLQVKHGEDIPSFADYEKFLKDIDIMLTCETPYVYEAWNWARMAGVKTICQPNWEFFDGLVQPNMPHPDQYIMPSYWHLADMQQRFPKTQYLPPPAFERDFENARDANLTRSGKKRFVHIVGTNAIYDRSGWAILRDALADLTEDFELVVYAQQDITGIADPRVKYHIFNIEDQEQLYTDFDALILPRRYGGLCLPMNEALMSALPVIMLDVDPVNLILPPKWLAPAYVSGSFEARSVIDIYSTNHLAEKIKWLCSLDDQAMMAQKLEAFDLGRQHFSPTTLKPQYIDLLNSITHNDK